MERKTVKDMLDFLYQQLALSGVTPEMVDLTTFVQAAETIGTTISTFSFNWDQVKLRIEDDGDALESITDMIKSILYADGDKKENLYIPEFQRVIGNIWDYYKPGYRVFITTNGTVKQGGAAVMGLGNAKEAKDRWPAIPLYLGNLLLQWYTKMHTDIPPIMWLKEYNIGIFPSKKQWYLKGDLSLIERSAKDLREMADEQKWTEKIVLPWPGCGAGGLKKQDVEPILKKYFDDRFILVELLR